MKEAYDALHLSIGSYTHSVINTDDPIYAVDFQELRTKIKDAWTALSSSWVTTQSYDGNGLRVKKNEYGTVTYYLRSTVLGGQVVAEMNGSGTWQRGYVYSGSSLLAVQQSGVFWVHEDPVTKSKRVTDVNGYVVSAVELDPWGADTGASWAQAFQPRKYASYERDLNGGDEAMFRRFNRKHARFDQPDPYDGSYDLSNPQSFNRYAYVQNDPVSFVDPTGLDSTCTDRNGNRAPCNATCQGAGGSFPCNSDYKQWQQENNPGQIVTNTSSWGYSVLPAWISGHSPTVISLIPADPTPREPRHPRQPKVPEATGYTCSTISGGPLSSSLYVDSNSQVYPAFGFGPSKAPGSFSVTQGSGPVRPGVYFFSQLRVEWL